MKQVQPKAGKSLRLEYVPLEDLKSAKRNPKQHDLGAIHQSMERFGYVEPIVRDDRTGLLVAGHGRVATLRQIHGGGGLPPAGVQVAKNGDWMVPVVNGWASKNNSDAEAYLVASNRLTMLGGWDEPELEKLLLELQKESDLEGTGYDADDLDLMLKELAPLEDPEEAEPKPPKQLECPSCHHIFSK